MQQPRLFSEGAVEPPQPGDQEAGRAAAPPRLRRPDRKQVEWRPLPLEALLPEDHPVRMVWRYVEGLDLTPLYAEIAAVEGHAGRPAADPRVLLALWLQATLDGVGSARAVDRLCVEHVVYMWLCGGVSMNYHTLADFRVRHGEFLDALLTQSVATLMHQDVVTLERVAQDGVRVRASAGSSSFRRQGSLEQCLAEAEGQVAALREELETDPGGTQRRQQAARERAARERAERVKRALKELEEVRSKKERRKKGSGAQARSSTTDAEARVMKMPGGGFRPGYNVQFAADTASQVVVGVDVTNAGSDGGQLAPMADQIETRCGRVPGAMLADSDYAKREDITYLGGPHKGVVVYAPVRESGQSERAPHTPRRSDSEAVAAWRVRMATPEAQEIYKERASTAECVNAQARNRGLYRFLVRGLRKVRTIALWYALAHNLRRLISLCPSAIGAA
jgi:transposase